MTISRYFGIGWLMAYDLESALLVLGLGGLLVLLASWLLRNPFRYPYFRHDFDVSGRRNVDIEDLVERYLLDSATVEKLRGHALVIEDWKRRCQAELEGRWLKGFRRRQFEDVVDDEHAFVFRTTRKQTRYRQRNYKRTPYKVVVEDGRLSVGLPWIEDRVDALVSIGYECTRKEYHARDQRRLMTPALRRQIMERDDYTCQICGKRMPDQVGLHIDHIVPVAKGGKTVPSNLQVLCSRCNGRKGKR